jgi:hypothetical protein
MTTVEDLRSGDYLLTILVNLFQILALRLFSAAFHKGK